jgi:hypothetical protein
VVDVGSADFVGDRDIFPAAVPDTGGSDLGEDASPDIPIETHWRR